MVFFVSYLNFLVIYTAYCIFYRSYSIIKYIPRIFYLKNYKYTYFPVFDLSKIQQSDKILCISKDDSFCQKIKNRLKILTCKEVQTDEDNFVDIELNTNFDINLLFKSQIDNITPLLVIKNKYIIVDFYNLNTYEHKYIHNILFFNIPYEKYSIVIKKYKHLIIDVSNDSICKFIV